MVFILARSKFFNFGLDRSSIDSLKVGTSGAQEASKSIAAVGIEGLTRHSVLSIAENVGAIA
jgi:hypothetical protein